MIVAWYLLKSTNCTSCNFFNNNMELCDFLYSSQFFRMSTSIVSDVCFFIYNATFDTFPFEIFALIQMPFRKYILYKNEHISVLKNLTV